MDIGKRKKAESKAGNAPGSWASLPLSTTSWKPNSGSRTGDAMPVAAPIFPVRLFVQRKAKKPETILGDPPPECRSMTAGNASDVMVREEFWNVRRAGLRGGPPRSSKPIARPERAGRRIDTGPCDPYFGPCVGRDDARGWTLEMECPTLDVPVSSFRRAPSAIGVREGERRTSAFCPAYVSRCCHDGVPPLLPSDVSFSHMPWPPRRRCLPGNSTSGWHTR